MRSRVRPGLLAAIILMVFSYIGSNTHYINPFERLLVLKGGEVRVAQPGYALVLWPLETSAGRYHTSFTYETSRTVLLRGYYSLIAKAQIRLSFSDDQLVQVFRYNAWPRILPLVENALADVAGRHTLPDIADSYHQVTNSMREAIQQALKPHANETNNITVSLEPTKETLQHINVFLRHQSSENYRSKVAEKNLELLKLLSEFVSERPEFKELLDFLLNILFPPPEEQHQHYEEPPRQEQRGRQREHRI